MWRLNPFWLTMLPEDDNLTIDWGQYFLNNEGIASPPVGWDAFKMHIRSTLITKINRLKRTSEMALTQASAEKLSVERAFIEDPMADRANNLKICSRLVEQMQYEKSKHKMLFHKQKLFEHWEKAGKLLAYLVHCKERPPVVISLCTSGGGLVTEPSQVTAIFRKFFSTLYTTTDDVSSMYSFLTEIHIPKLTEEQTAELEAPLTTEIIAEAIA